MRSRLLRAVLILTAVIGAGVLVLAFTVVPSTAEKQEVREAGRIARDYERRLDREVEELGAYVVKRRFENETDYQKLHDEVGERIEAVPAIPRRGTTAFGREGSRDYRNAADRRELELRQYEAFMVELEDRIIPRQEFVEAGIDLVKVNPLKLLEGFFVSSGAPLRTEVVPEYRKARKKLLATRPGNDEAELARDLEQYADDTITMVRGGAADLDAGRPFFFDFGDEPNLLLSRLEAAQRAIAAEVSTMVDAIDTMSGAVNDPAATQADS